MTAFYWVDTRTRGYCSLGKTALDFDLISSSLFSKHMILFEHMLRILISILTLTMFIVSSSSFMQTKHRADGEGHAQQVISKHATGHSAQKHENMVKKLAREAQHVTDSETPTGKKQSGKHHGQNGQKLRCCADVALATSCNLLPVCMELEIGIASLQETVSANFWALDGEDSPSINDRPPDPPPRTT